MGRGVGGGGGRGGGGEREQTACNAGLYPRILGS